MIKINVNNVNNMDSLKEITFNCFSYAYLKGFISLDKYKKFNGFMRNEYKRVNDCWLKNI